MNLLAIRRSKCDLSKMIKMVHKRSTWGKKYTYATNDEHDVYIEISHLNFRKGIIYFRVFFDTVYDTAARERETEVKYHMGRTDDSIEKLERRINNSILNELDDCLRRELERFAERSDEYSSLNERQDNDEESYRTTVEEQYKGDENKEIIVDALVDEYTKYYWEERMKFKGQYILDNKAKHKKDIHRQYEEILKNPSSDETSSSSEEGLPF